MKIAIATDDSTTISAHFGRAQYFDVFTIVENVVTARETRPKANHNQFVGEHHGHEHRETHGAHPESLHRHNAMIQAIHDCQVLIARGMGMGAYQSLSDAGISPILTDIGRIEEALQAYLAGTLVNHPEKLH